MSRTTVVSAAFAWMSLPLAAFAGELDWQGADGWGPSSGYQRAFDVETRCTIEGEVLALRKASPARGMGEGIHLLLRAGEARYDVHLGPAWYVLRQETRLQLRDRVAVTGSLTRWNDVPVLIAVSVRKAEGILRLRDDQGYPLWAGARPDRAPKGGEPR